MNKTDAEDVALLVQMRTFPLRLALLEITRQLHARGALDVAEMRSRLRQVAAQGLSRRRIETEILDLCRALENIAPPVSLVPDPPGTETHT